MNTTVRNTVLNSQRPIRVAITLAIGLLVLRTWLMLGLVAPVHVAGDSMAGTLLGPHHVFTCQTCGHHFPVSAERMRTDRMAVCPLCRQTTGPTDETNLSSGQHLLIDRTAFQFRRPRRWEVVVFRCPERAADLCVKRVVGLPGEQVEIRDGDIYVDGQICRKDLSRQRAVRQLVDKTSGDHRPVRWRPSSWTAQPPTTPRSATGWRSDGDHFMFEPPTIHKPPSETDWLTYYHNDGRPIRDDAATNQNVTRRLNLVADVMLSCRVQIERRATDPPGRLLLSATDFREPFEVHITPALREICLLRNGRIVWRTTLDGDPFRQPIQIELSLFDRQLLMAIDGQTCLTYPYQAADRPSRPTSRPLAIGVQNLAVSVDRLSVWRDVYYGPLAGSPFPSGGAGHGLSGECQLGPNEFFVLGDNSPISLDSRTWQMSGLAAKFLVGKPLGVQ